MKNSLKPWRHLSCRLEEEEAAGCHQRYVLFCFLFRLCHCSHSGITVSIPFSCRTDSQEIEVDPNDPSFLLAKQLQQEDWAGPVGSHFSSSYLPQPSSTGYALPFIPGTLYGSGMAIANKNAQLASAPGVC